jgi:hypothetical protein
VPKAVRMQTWHVRLFSAPFHHLPYAAVGHPPLRPNQSASVVAASGCFARVLIYRRSASLCDCQTVPLAHGDLSPRRGRHLDRSSDLAK